MLSYFPLHFGDYSLEAVFANDSGFFIRILQGDDELVVVVVEIVTLFQILDGTQ